MPTSTRSLNRHVFWVSTLILFLEILVIRWLSTEVRVFAYLHNMVLIAAFLGMGMGCYAAGRRSYPVAAAATLAILVFLAQDPLRLGWLPFKSIPQDLASVSSIDLWFTQKSATVPWGAVLRGFSLTLLGFLAVAFTFFPLGQLLGRSLDAHPRPIEAYSVNIVGSLVGVWLFNALCWAWLPPAVWCLAALLLFLAALAGLEEVRASERAACATLVGLCAAMTWSAPSAGETVWSPYQRLVVQRAAVPGSDVPQGYAVDVNGVFYLGALDLSERFQRQHPALFNPAESELSWYNLPWKLAAQPPVSALIVGAGAGNDAAGALRAGCKDVVGVEIDPAIVHLGRKYHPEGPYLDPRVQIVVDDARSWFKRGDRKFDVVRFGLLDSHTQASGYNNLRLDNYVYTRESFEEARRLLEPHGLLMCSFQAQREYIGDRLSLVLTQVFGERPVCYWVSGQDGRYGPGGLVFLSTNDGTNTELARRLSALSQGRGRIHSVEARHTAPPATDDWPYLYLERPSLPTEYIVFSALILLILGLLKQAVFQRGEHIEWHFFFLGAAFMLLEVHSISQSMLLFGTTWVVNSFVITAVLMLIYLANLVVRAFGERAVLPAVVGLLLSVAVNLLVRASAFAFLEPTLRALASSFVLCLPIFFAGIIFATGFARCERRDLALGSNLIGAIVGGLLESFSFLLGLHFISVLVLVLYLLALLTLPRARAVPATA